jgi:hypothetical protein
MSFSTTSLLSSAGVYHQRLPLIISCVVISFVERGFGSEYVYC